MTLIVKDGQNNNQSLKTVEAGSEHVSYHNELADWFLRVARGNESGIELVHVFGESSAIGFNDSDIWSVGGTITQPSADTLLDISSSSTNDTSGGTGARTATISGVTSAGVEVEETVVLMGTSKVATSNSFFRVNSVTVATTGVDNQNDGILTVETAGSPSDVITKVPAGENRASQTHYHIPTGKQGFILSFFGSAEVGNGLEYTLWANQVVDHATQILTPVAPKIKVYQGMESLSFRTSPIRVEAQGDIVVRGRRYDTSGDVPGAAGYSMLIVSNSQTLG